MIELMDVSFRYAGAAEGNESLSHIDLSVRAGEFVLLTGKSGCGKTTLTRILNGLCPGFYEGNLSGRYLLEGRETSELSLSEIGKAVGSVFQDPRSQFFCTNTTDEVVFSMESRAYPKPLMDRRLEELWDILPIQNLMGKKIFNLSSGEKQKVAIASVCATEPKVLVLDEPSANLDAQSTEQLAVLLMRLKAMGHAIIVSEHRIHYLSHLFDRLIVMDDGRILNEYSKKEALHLTDDVLEKQGLRKLYQPTLVQTALSPRTIPAFVDGKDIYIRKQNQQIINNLSIQIFPGEITAITGSNGAGKSTLCKALTGAERESSGVISYGGSILKPKARVRQSFLVQQDTDYQLYSSSVFDELLLGLPNTPEIRREAELYLGELNLNPLRNRHPASLSGGQKQRVLIAAAALRHSNLLVLDEPTSGLDGLHMRQTAQILRKLAERGCAIVLITHDIELIEKCVTRICHIQNGNLCYESCL